MRHYTFTSEAIERIKHMTMEEVEHLTNLKDTLEKSLKENK